MHANLSYARIADRSRTGADRPETLSIDAARCVDEALGEQFSERSTETASIRDILAYCAVDTIALAHLLDRIRLLARRSEQWIDIEV
jgi:chorismate-pyruvate lyase